MDMQAAMPARWSTQPQPTSLASRLPQLDANELVVRNRVYESAPCFLGEDRVLVWQANPALTVAGELICNVGGESLAIAANGLGRIEPRLEGFENFIPAEMCTALVEHALNPFISMLERVSGVSVEAEAFVRGGGHSGLGDEVTVGFAMLDAAAKPLVRGWVRALPSVWAAFDFGRALQMPAQRQLGLSVRLSIELGRCRVTARELYELKTGDAIRPATRLLRDAQVLPVHLTNISGRFAMAARIEGHDFFLENRVSTDYDQNQGSAGGAENTGGEDLLSDIECDLSFELGSMRLTVAEIARMRAGQTLRLGVRLQDQPVRLLVNGRLIGRGELAAVGDELVVVVTDTSKLPQV
jgi:type III secretion protein Q